MKTTGDETKMNEEFIGSCFEEPRLLSIKCLREMWGRHLIDMLFRHDHDYRRNWICYRFNSFWARKRESFQLGATELGDIDTTVEGVENRADEFSRIIIPTTVYA